MALLTSLNVEPKKTYMKQISVYGSKVHIEIIYTDKKTDWNRSVDLWYCSMRKEFGSMWRSEPNEKDYQDAHKWADEQLNLLEKYGTVKVKQAEYIYEIERNDKSV